ncbi:hypothetical protein [Micromonospora zhanjiangensis]|uniref:Uncharacterized protein n=1 Tax=Micromonospora zhanjiangensis TaxID=1522057 RepID=A0ABV8KKZ1_9ACTN
MTAYDDYLRAVGGLLALRAHAEQEARTEAERQRRELEGVQADAQSVTARNGRLRKEVTRQLEFARSVLLAADHGEMLPLPLEPTHVEQATDRDVTEAVRTLQARVVELVTVASRPGPPLPEPERAGNGGGRAWPKVAGALLVVVLITAALLVVYGPGRS